MYIWRRTLRRQEFLPPWDTALGETPTVGSTDRWGQLPNVVYHGGRSPSAVAHGGRKTPTVGSTDRWGQLPNVAYHGGRSPSAVAHGGRALGHDVSAGLYKGPSPFRRPPHSSLQTFGF
jgi:hypothetical protein